uniref:Uncharacterized protein n=1 Tax=Myoviridae sp. cte5Z19 TaxID=2825145 RepID=A0A8S5NW22_9CAUD|nr:MAG TPA: hypothetical protein [Myoviridae sp. cte5Z19]
MKHSSISQFLLQNHSFLTLFELFILFIHCI